MKKRVIMASIDVLNESVNVSFTGYHTGGMQMKNKKTCGECLGIEGDDFARCPNVNGKHWGCLVMAGADADGCVVVDPLPFVTPIEPVKDEDPEQKRIAQKTKIIAALSPKIQAEVIEIIERETVEVVAPMMTESIEGDEGEAVDITKARKMRPSRAKGTG